jgi:hypothetical protein
MWRCDVTTYVQSREHGAIIKIKTFKQDKEENRSGRLGLHDSIENVQRNAVLRNAVLCSAIESSAVQCN